MVVVVKQTTFAVIPARGGSKRIPHKNIIDFCGKPMIAWTIQAALDSQCFDRVFVDTDCEEIASIAIAHGAEVPFLRGAHSDDFSPVSQATIQFISNLQSKLGLRADVVFQLMANCPIRGEKEIQKFRDRFLQMDTDFLISCFPFGWMNPWWAFKLKDGSAEKLFPEALKKRSQDLEKLYCPTGAIWGAKVAKLIEQGTFYGIDHKFFELDWKSALDIDDYEDLEMATAVKLMISRKLS